jgi:carbon monoxide dehydrogenase subunit G
MPTFTTRERQVVTIRAPRVRVAEALSTPERLEQLLAVEIESSTRLDAQTVRWIRKPVAVRGFQFRGEYTARYEYDGDGHVRWYTIGEGNVRSQGEARLFELGDGTTRVEYQAAIECDMDVHRVLALVLRPLIEHRIKSGLGAFVTRVKRSLELSAA